jgi:hypothetical protein
MNKWIIAGIVLILLIVAGYAVMNIKTDNSVKNNQTQTTESTGDVALDNLASSSEDIVMDDSIVLSEQDIISAP